MNRLGSEISPYLLQHAHNPVDWFPWGQEAFAKARMEGKPVFLSIGYSSCHWCHVMEGDSFEKDDVAAILNDHFVAIKVDREERPDVDSLYMKAVNAMNQPGGWPLSVVLTPEGKPFWGGTFFPREQFKQILSKLAGLWKTHATDIEEGAAELLGHIRSIGANHGTAQGYDAIILRTFLTRQLESYDPEWGGFGGAPKFPHAMNLLALMRVYRATGDKRALDAVTGTLDGLARGGIRDHVGGGFHRYAVDETWLVPHFEKMLYDNALLTYAYSEAFQVTRSDAYRDVVRSTLAYVMRDMQLPEGGYCSAEDADSEKTEGKFYLWTGEQLRATLGADGFATMQKYFAVAEDGNFHVERRVEELETAAGLQFIQKGNILHQQKAKDLVTDRDPVYREILAQLWTQRALRARPLRDDKVITFWNGLMIGAMAKAHKVFGEPLWRESASRSADFVLRFMLENGRLLRCRRQGQNRVNAFMEDYAGMIFGLIELYEATFEPRFIKAAIHLQESQDRWFWDQHFGGYFESDGEDASLLLRTKEFPDHATPTGNSLSAWNLLRLAAFTTRKPWEDQAQVILNTCATSMQKFPEAFPMLMLSIDWLQQPHFEYVIATDDAAALRWPELCPDFAGHVVFMQAHAELIELCPQMQGKIGKNSQTVYYLCQQGRCQRPTPDANAIHETLRVTRDGVRSTS